MSKINLILKKSLNRKRKEEGQFSIRILAKQLKIHHSFLSALLNGKKTWPLPLLDRAIEILQIDELSRRRMAEILTHECLTSLQKKSKLLKKYLGIESAIPKDTSSSIDNFSEIAPTATQLLSHWYFIAVLDLATCEDFKLDFNWISQRLNITPYEAQFAWQFLISQNYIHNINGRWQKTDLQLRIPTVEHNENVRKYHKEMLLKALSFLKSTNSVPGRHEQRLCAGLSVASNPTHFEQANLLLHESAYQSAQLLNQGQCSEVFQIYVLMFPISRPLSG